MNKTLKYTLYNNPINISISKSRRKSISLEVKPSGKVIIKAPFFIRSREILGFVKDKEDWIKTRLDKLKSASEQYPLTHGSEIPFMGIKLTLTMVNINCGIQIKDNNLLIPSKEEDITSSLKKWYRERAREIITPLVEKYCYTLGVSYNRISIKAQKTRWGSCSSKKNLNFNWKVILTSSFLIEYLVIHEVCHLVHLNHSRDFWNLVATLDRDYKVHKKELQKAGFYLLSFLE